MSRIGDIDFCQKFRPSFTESENVALFATPIFPKPPSPPTYDLNHVLWPQPNWSIISGDKSAGKLRGKSGSRL